MKFYILKNKLKLIKQKREYDKYYASEKVVISTTKNIKYKLQDIIKNISVFKNFNDIFVFCIYIIENNYNLFKFQSMKLVQLINDLNKDREKSFREITYSKGRHRFWKKKYLTLKKQTIELERVNKKLNKQIKKYSKQIKNE